MDRYLLSGQFLQLIAPSGGVLAGRMYKIGAFLILATVTAAAGSPFIAATEGVFTVTKPTDETWTEGVVIYWDDVTKAFTTSSTDTTPVGAATEAATMSAIVGTIRLGVTGAMVAAGGGAGLSGLTAGTVPVADSATSVVDSDGLAGPVLLGAGPSQGLTVQAGDAPDAASDGGALFLRAGDGGVDGVGGHIILKIGAGDTSGKIIIQDAAGVQIAEIANDGDLLVIGNVTAPALVGTVAVSAASLDVGGMVTLNALPTSDPVTVNQIWNDGGTLKVSAG